MKYIDGKFVGVKREPRAKQVSRLEISNRRRYDLPSYRDLCHAAFRV